MPSNNIATTYPFRTVLVARQNNEAPSGKKRRNQCEGKQVQF